MPIIPHRGAYVAHYDMKANDYLHFYEIKKQMEYARY